MVESSMSSEEMHPGTYHSHHPIEHSEAQERLSQDRHLDSAPEPEINANGYYVVDHHALSQLPFLKGGNFGQPHIPQELSSWDAAPPIKFQQQFLW
jgi:hypothetical protein